MIPLLLLAMSPQESIDIATKDAQSLPSATHVRYISAYNLKGSHAEIQATLNFWLNSLSREAELVKLHVVSPGLWRLDLRDYGFKAQTWDALPDPYFTIPIKKDYQVLQNGQWVVKTFDIRASAPWTNQTKLLALTQSQVPIVRADWFLVQTSQQIDREGTGYYDWLRVKNRKDFQDLVGLDQKKAESLQKEIRAIVARSGVTLNNRQIIRFATITGSYWVTLDVINQKDNRNALRNLNGDYKHDAEEIYGNLPNGLFAFFLSDAQGNRQDAAPDNIAADHQAPGNDKRVHIGHSCIRCHTVGIQPIKDWGRKVYTKNVALTSPDYEKLRRLRRLYLTDLEKYIRRDVSDYSETVLSLTGMKADALSKAFAKYHTQYQEADLDIDTIAIETGYSKEKILAALKGQKYLDPVLASLLQDETIRREHLEEAFPLLMKYLKAGP